MGNHIDLAASQKLIRNGAKLAQQMLAATEKALTPVFTNLASQGSLQCRSQILSELIWKTQCFRHSALGCVSLCRFMAAPWLDLGSKLDCSSAFSRLFINDLSSTAQKTLLVLHFALGIMCKFCVKAALCKQSNWEIMKAWINVIISAFARNRCNQ